VRERERERRLEEGGQGRVVVQVRSSEEGCGVNTIERRGSTVDVVAVAVVVAVENART
jgi:hypothetical protein